MQLLLAVTLVTLLTVARGQTEDCKPGVNCRPPNCRCWNDDTIPGNIPQEDTPQVVLLTFQYAVNAGNVDFYRAVFGSAKNPNQCPVAGTFFVQQTSSDLGVIKALYDTGHEIGTTTIDGTTPQTAQEWTNNFLTVKNSLRRAGIDPAGVLGVRAPELKPGGLDQWVALSQDGFLYDASCTRGSASGASGFFWPYTYDFAPGLACDSGEGPEQVFPGKWQFVLADLVFNNTRCATPSACTAVASQRDAFDLFYNSFIQHYEGTREPFIVAVNPDWVTVDFKRAGTQQFIEYIRAAFPDVWVLTMTQSLEWVRNPVNNTMATVDYPAWSCL